jgi:signal transduction histidine kinase/ActR/RegA family two-component response regulator
MIFKKSHRLSFRINATIWRVCAGLLLLFILLFYAFEKQQLRAHIDQSKVLLEALFQQKRERLANEIFAGHREALAQTLVELKSVQNIGGVYVFDLKGRLLESAGRKRRGDLSDEVRSTLSKGPVFKDIELEGRQYLTYTSDIEIIGERQGYFAIYFDLSDVRHASFQRILFIVGIFAGSLGFMSLLLHLLLTRLVIKPVSLVRNAMEQVMNGQLGEQVALKLSDEIGEVAASFNAMSKQLKEQHERLMRSMSLRDSYAQQLEETNRKLAQLNADLETIVEKRTRELQASNENLRNQIRERIRTDQAKRALEERLARSQKMEALGLLAGGVAHDLNNVLSGIVSYPDLLLMELTDDDPHRKIVEGIQKSGRRAAAIVEDLLVLARRGVPQTRVLHLNEDVIQEYLRSPEFSKLQSYHPAVVIETDLDQGLMNIRGSIVHLRKSLMNLVSNAVEAQPQGGRVVIGTRNQYVDLPISGYDQVNEGDYVVLRVEDKGQGIAEEDLERIFEPFYTKKVMGRSGTGLGMAVIWGTVQDHKGYINVTSCIDEGTVFELYFPVSREKVDAIEEHIHMDTYMGMKEKVLVIDDVEEQRIIASALLSRLNYQVYAVGSGEAAIAFLSKEKVDILVLDMIMDPGIDGLDTYTKIIETHPGQKAVIASGYAESTRVKMTQQLGAGTYIRKPYTLEKIGIAVRAELDS